MPTARIAYVVRSSREEAPRLFSASLLRTSIHEAPPLVATHLPLEGDPGIPFEPEIAVEIGRRAPFAWLIAGEGPVAAVLADAAAALDSAFAGQETGGFVEDLGTGRLMCGVEARNEIPGRLASFLRIERHATIAVLEGGVVTRGLAKLGMPEIALACEEPRRLAAALVLRRAVREALLSGRPLSAGDRRALEGGVTLEVRPTDGAGSFLAAAREAIHGHARPAARLCPLLPDAPEVLVATLLDARGEADTAAVLDAIPAGDRPKVRTSLTTLAARAVAEALSGGRGEEREIASLDEDDDEDDGDVLPETALEGDPEGAPAEAVPAGAVAEPVVAAEDSGEARVTEEAPPETPDVAADAPAASEESSSEAASSEAASSDARGEQRAEAEEEAAAPETAFAAWAGAPGPEGAEGLAAIFSGRPARGMDGAALEARVAAAGVLQLPSGAVVACDALSDTLAEPLPLALRPGGYPVYLALARPGGGGERVAAVALLVSAEAPARWERSWKHDVDSGASAFIDRQVGIALAQAEASGRGPGDALARALGDHTAALVTVGAAEDGTRVNVALFAAGFGDGSYLTYLARDAEGAPVAAVTGFAIVLGDAPKAGDREAPRKAPGPPPGTDERATLDTLLRMLNMDRRMGGCYDEFAAALGKARLERRGLPGGDVEIEGAGAIAASLAAHPLPDEIAFAIDEGATDRLASAVFAWRSSPRTKVGTVRCEFSGGEVVKLAILVDPA